MNNLALFVYNHSSWQDFDHNSKENEVCSHTNKNHLIIVEKKLPGIETVHP